MLWSYPTWGPYLNNFVTDCSYPALGVKSFSFTSCEKTSGFQGIAVILTVLQKKKKNQSLKFCIFFQPGDCCWWVYLALSSGEISHLQTESRRKELPCVLQALLRCSSTAKIKTRDHKGWGFSGKLTIYRLFAEVTVFTSLLFSNTIFYWPIWELFLPKTCFEASQAVFWSLSGY